MDALLQQFSEEAQQLKAPSAFRERFIANLVIAASRASHRLWSAYSTSFVRQLADGVLFVCGLVGPAVVP
ncbi:hypothetical protein GS491_23370 [Rhodococcus hoagii]|nr:hypothetical protein [Prescottella equi]